MTTFKKKVEEHLFSSKFKNTNKEKVDLEDHFIDQLKFREEITDSSYGVINYIQEVDSKTYLRLDRNLPFDSSNLTKEAKNSIKNITDNKIAIFIKHKETEAIFVRLYDMPKKDSWDDSEIKNLLYSEGITADSIEDIVGKRVNIRLNTDESETNKSGYELLHNIVLKNIFIIFVLFMMIISIHIQTLNILSTLIITLPLVICLVLLMMTQYNLEKGGD